MNSGYCIYVENFYATVVKFKTLSIQYAIDTVPFYTILLENGIVDERNETELVFSKKELEEKAIELNKKMEKDRKYWHRIGLPALMRAGFVQGVTL